jgi:hypothetical protein
MGTVSGPPVSLNQARAAMNRGPGSLLELRRGAGIVPNIPQNQNVPAAGSIGLSQLAGATDYVPMSVSVAGTNVDLFRNEPAPSTIPFTAALIPSVTNGTGNYSIAWALVSADGINSFSWSQQGTQARFSGNATKNDTRRPVFQLTINDGVAVYQANITATVNYRTDV